MNEKEKRQLALIIGGIIILVILYLLMRKGSGSTTYIDEAGMPINVQIPSFDLPPRTGYPINIPPLGERNQYDYSGISVCACGNGTTQTYNERVVEKQVEKVVEKPLIQKPINLAIPQQKPWFSDFAAGPSRPWYEKNPYFRG